MLHYSVLVTKLEYKYIFNPGRTKYKYALTTRRELRNSEIGIIKNRLFRFTFCAAAIIIIIIITIRKLTVGDHNLITASVVVQLKSACTSATLLSIY